MKGHTPRTAWKETKDSGRMVLMIPDNYRPDLVSPVLSARSPSPGHAYPKGYRTPRYFDNSEPTVTKSHGYSDDFQPSVTHSRTIHTYSADFDSDSASNTLNIPMYTEDFQSVTQRSGARPHITKHSAAFSGELETIKTSIAETVPEETEAPTIDSYDDVTYRETTSGRTSRLTWQYSEDFEDTNREESVSEDTQRSTEESYSASVSTTRRRSYYGDDSTDDQTSWAESSQDSDGTSEAAYLAEKTFLEKTLKKLQQPSRVQKENVSTVPQIPHPLITKQFNHRKPDREEVKALKTFFRAVSEKAKNRKGDKAPRLSDTRYQSVKYQLMGIRSDDYVENYGISPLAINRLRLENTKAKLDKMAKEVVHDPRDCPNCKPVLENLAKMDFIKSKLHAAQEHLIKEKIDQVANSHFTAKLAQDPSSMPGSMQRTLGHLPSSEIWNKLGLHSSHQDPSSQDEISEHVPISLQKTPSEFYSITCPHMIKHHPKHANAHLKTKDMDQDIQDYIQETEIFVNKVKQELLMESENLKSLDTEQFWKLYFEKLRGFDGLPGL